MICCFRCCFDTRCCCVCRYSRSCGTVNPLSSCLTRLSYLSLVKTCCFLLFGRIASIDWIKSLAWLLCCSLIKCLKRRSAGSCSLSCTSRLLWKWRLVDTRLEDWMAWLSWTRYVVDTSRCFEKSLQRSIATRLREKVLCLVNSKWSSKQVRTWTFASHILLHRPWSHDTTPWTASLHCIMTGMNTSINSEMDYTSF